MRLHIMLVLWLNRIHLLHENKVRRTMHSWKNHGYEMILKIFRSHLLYLRYLKELLRELINIDLFRCLVISGCKPKYKFESTGQIIEIYHSTNKTNDIQIVAIEQSQRIFSRKCFRK